tara:strand:- start:283 stop:609 length:327 start_codon:yes stop_codon:yes gene_type:complete
VKIIEVNKSKGARSKVMQVKKNGLEIIKTRHKLIIYIGSMATIFGVAMGGVVGYEWFVNHIGHEVLAIVSVFGILLGVQILILASLSSMLIALHHEQMHHVEILRKKE